MSMDSRSRLVSGGGIRGVGCPPGPQYGVNRRQPPHGQQQHRLSGKSNKPDPWLAGTAPECTTALAMLKNAARLDRLSFGCPSLDAAFEGGVRVQGITEIAGEAGAGKTQLCLQLLLQAQLAPEAGGLGGKSYVLTCGEGDFPSRRLRQMASTYQSRHGVKPEKLMEGVCIQNAKTLDDQMMIIMEHLPHIMRSQNVKLVVIDSIAALFRSDLGCGRGDIGERSRLLGRLSQQMKRLGDRHGAAFVVVNQVTAKFGSSTIGGGGGGQGTMGGVGGSGGGGGGGSVPAMGLLWSQCINTRFKVRRRDYRLSLQPPPSSESGSRQRATPNPRDQNSSSLSLPSAAAARRLGGGGGVNPPLVHPPDPNVGGGGGGSGDGGVCSRSAGPPPCSSSSAIAREITLDMSPCVPVHARCGFVVERSGVRGVG
ncbi:unnamed protein product [Ectocarpus sp. CCAP 1310/34]|nr:unnamed protein product [Ectocarpus sp. CCAP 1310/34]